MHCSCDHHYRQNPLKEKIWKERIQELSDLGADPEKLQQIIENFNTEHNDSTHTLYIADWYRARLLLERYAGTEQELQALSRYYSKYKLSDYHDLSLDGQLQIDYFDTFLHYAQLAHTQYVFRRYPWDSVSPSRLIEQLKERESSAEVKLYYRPKYHEPLISFPNGWSWVVMRPEDKESEADSLSDCASPEGDQSIVISLRQPFEAGYYQTRLRAQLTFPESVKFPKEHDYNSENRPEGVSYTQWRDSYPQRFREAITTELIKASPMLLVQLRSYHNHKPGTPLGMEETGGECYQCIKLGPKDMERIRFEDYLPYLTALLSQSWITWVLKPRYRPEGSFQLGELPKEVRANLYQTKPWMFNIRSFNRKFSVKNYGNRLDEVFFATPSQIIQELQAGQTNQFKRRLEAGVKYQRNRMFQAIEDVLMRTKNKGTIKRLLALLADLNKFRQAHRIVTKFFQERLDWLFHNFNYLTQTLEIVSRNIMPRAQYRDAAIDGETYKAIKEYLLNNESASLTLFKALFEARITSNASIRYRGEEPEPLSLENRRQKIAKRSQLYLSELLQIILSKIDYTPELYEWTQRRPLPFGNSETRLFLNDWKATPNLLKQLLKLYSGTEVERYVVGKLVKSERTQLRELAAGGPTTSRRLARKLIDAIYQNIYSSDEALRRQTGSLLEDISRRRRLRRRTR